MLDKSIRDNEAALERIADSLRYSDTDSIYRLDRVLVVGGASPEGTIKLNHRLSKKRADVLFNYLSRYGNLPDSLTNFNFLGRDWYGLVDLVEADDNVPYKEETLEFLHDITGRLDGGEKLADNNVGRLSRFKGGAPYRYMYHNLFPELRASSVYLWYRREWNPISVPSGVLVSGMDFAKPPRLEFKPLHFERIVKALHEIPDKIEIALKKNAYIADFAKIFTYSRNFLYLGRGYNYPLALEGALKLKEISYIHAEGYPAAEMKHGPIALIDAEMPIVVIAPNKGNYEKIVSNIQEVKARKGRVISIVSEGDTEVKALSDFSIEIPETEEALVPVLACIPLQLLAYHIAVQKGCNVDQPRNLAKSVTVE